MSCGSGAFGFADDAAALEVRAALRPLLEMFPFASVTLIGRERAGVLFRAAAATPADPALMTRIDNAFRLDGDAVARYDDARRGVGRRVRVVDGRLAAVRLSGDTAAETWLREWLVSAHDVSELGALLLLPGAKAPAGFVSRGRVVCTCFDVAETALRNALAAIDGPAALALAKVQDALQCGTNCGSCLPELKHLAAETRSEATRR